jgi:mannose-6-phosphate isomerase
MYNPKKPMTTERSMNGHSDTEKSPSAPVLPEILYATPQYQVCLRRLLPRQFFRPECPTDVSVYDCLLVEGALLDEAAQALTPGACFDGLQAASSAIWNASSQEALYLEMMRGRGFAPVPLPEVTETRPWGSFTVLKDEPDYKLKQLTVKPGNRLSLQRHQKREEHWLITCGYPEITLNDRRVRFGPGDYIHIPLHSWHRIANPASVSGEPSDLVEIIELQLGTYFGEDDIERREDDYGRI